MKTHESVLLFCKVIFRHVSMRDSYLNWRDAISLNSTRTHTHTHTHRQRQIHIKKRFIIIFFEQFSSSVTSPYMFPSVFFQRSTSLNHFKESFFLKIIFQNTNNAKTVFFEQRAICLHRWLLLVDSLFVLQVVECLFDICSGRIEKSSMCVAMGIKRRRICDLKKKKRKKWVKQFRNGCLFVCKEKRSHFRRRKLQTIRPFAHVYLLFCRLCIAIKYHDLIQIAEFFFYNIITLRLLFFVLSSRSFLWHTAHIFRGGGIIASKQISR